MFVCEKAPIWRSHVCLQARLMFQTCEGSSHRVCGSKRNMCVKAIYPHAYFEPASRNRCVLEHGVSVQKKYQLCSQYRSLRWWNRAPKIRMLMNVASAWMPESKCRLMAAVTSCAVNVPRPSVASRFCSDLRLPVLHCFLSFQGGCLNNIVCR